MKTIKIKVPFFGAGSPKQYNWVKDGYHIWGIGVKVDDVKNHEVLNIVLEGIAYPIKTQDIKDFVRKYNSTYEVKKSLTKLVVFSTSLLNGFQTKEGKDIVNDFLDTWGTKPKEEVKGTLF